MGILCVYVYKYIQSVAILWNLDICSIPRYKNKNDSVVSIIFGVAEMNTDSAEAVEV